MYDSLIPECRVWSLHFTPAYSNCMYPARVFCEPVDKLMKQNLEGEPQHPTTSFEINEKLNRLLGNLSRCNLKGKSISQHSTFFTLVQILLAYDSHAISLVLRYPRCSFPNPWPDSKEASKLWVQVQEASRNTNACTFSRVHFVFLF